MSSKSKSKPKEVSLQIYARVRGLMPWEPPKVSLAVVGNRVQNKSGKITTEYSFKCVFKPKSTNEQCFQTIAMPMIGNVLKGFNAVLIAYGQTGSGKTFSMLGKPKLNIVGILPKTLAYFTHQRQVTKVELTAVEAFGHHVAKIFLFDLFNKSNKIKDWNLKKGKTTIETKRAIRIEINDANDAHDKIIYAHAASHFAPTGKNPESSRGHVTFVATIHQSNSKENMINTSYFVMVDCAGSEGESAFTPEFRARITPQVLLCRRLEAGTINTGLSALQVIFNELRLKGKISATIGNGLRRVLHPYINTKTYLSVLFALSPSIINAKSTESTLKFAVTAGMVKVKPVAVKGKVNFKTLISELKEHLLKQEEIIHNNNDQIGALRRQHDRTKLEIKNYNKIEIKKQIKKTRIIKRELINNDNGEIEIIEEEEEYFIDQEQEQQQQQQENNNNNNNNDDGNDNDNTVHVNDDDLMQLMELLDLAGRELLNELGDDFKISLVELEESQQSSQQLESSTSSYNIDATATNIILQEDNEDAMKLAMEQYKQLTAPWQKEAFIKKKQIEITKRKKKEQEKKDEEIKRNNGLSLIDEQIKQSQNDYKRLQERQQDIINKLNDSNNNVKKEELTEHAMELQIMLAEQTSVTENLKQSKQVIIDYLKADGREALVQFFKIKKLVD